MIENRNDNTIERKIDLPVDDNLMELVDELTESDDEVIDLVEEADDDIIDLEDEPKESLFDEESIDLVAETDDDIIDLEDDDEVIDLSESTDTDLIELDLEADEAEPESGEGNGIIELSDAVEEAASVAEKVIFIEDDTQSGQPLDADADAETSKDDALSLPAGVEVTEQQIDAALERVIKKMFAKRIDGILTTLIDRTILKELKALQDKLAGN